MKSLKRVFKIAGLIFLFSIPACRDSGTGTIIYTSANKPEYNNYSVRLWLAGYDPSDQYLESVASRFDLVLTAGGELASRVKRINPNVKCAYYSNPVFTQPSVKYPEAFYAHSGDSTNTRMRIKNSVHGTFLMDISSDEWINQYSDDLLSNIGNWKYDSIFADDCGPFVSERIDFVPDNYVDVDNWLSEIRDVLRITKKNVGNGTELVFNGIYKDLDYNGRDLLQIVDGSLMEGFVFSLQLGDFLPESLWKVLLNWIIEDTENDLHFANAKFKHNGSDQLNIVSTDDRMFAFTSYLLVRNENLFFSIDDWALVTGYNMSLTQYYPEMDVDLGTSSDNCSRVEDYYNDVAGLYERKFEKGIVFVNPSEKSVRIDLSEKNFLVVPQGGGVINENGACDGKVILKIVKSFIIPEQSGAIILYPEFI